MDFNNIYQRLSPFALLITAALCLSAPATAQESSSRRVVTQAVPSVKNIHRVVAAKTPSGFEVPRYVSLKFGKINGRAGPSQNHPIKWQYRRSGLPVIVVAETENWRKIRDLSGDESWIYKAGLSGERYVISLGETKIMKRPNPAAYTLAIADANALLRLESCEQGWCKVFSKDGHRGWTKQSDIWGAAPLF